MPARDEPLDPQEVLEAAEAAHLAARRTPPTGPADTAGVDRLGGDRAPAPKRARAPLPLAAAVVAGWAALVAYAPIVVVVVLLQAAEGGPVRLGGAMRTAAAGWLLAHGVPIATSAGVVGLAPLTLAALAAWRVARAGVHVTRVTGARGTGSIRGALVGAVAVAAAYGLLATLAAMLVNRPGWEVAPVRAGLTFAGFGLVAAGYGALRTAKAFSTLAGRIPSSLHEGGRAGLIAATVLLAVGAAAAGIAIAVGGGAAADTLVAYRTGVAGQAGLTLLCLAYAPNLAVWAAAYLVGPGFAVGAGTVVSGGEVAIGSLPPLPVFAGLPEGPLPTVGAVLLAVPVIAGGLAGWLLARTPVGWGRLMGAAALSGPVAGGLLGLAAALSGGPVGGGQLATMGPSPLPVALFATVMVTVGALLGATVTAFLTRR